MTAPRLRVAFFNRSYYPDFGATGQLLTELAEDLVARHGHEVTVVAGLPLSSASPMADPPTWYRPVKVEHHKGVRILRAYGTAFDKKKFAGRASNYLSYFLTSMLATFRLGRPDIVVALTDPPIIGLVADAAARLTGARFVFLCQDIFPEVARLLEDFQSGRVESLLQRIGRYTVARADRVIALGDTMKRRLVETKGADPSKVRVVHNWADCEAIVPASKDNPFARAHGLADTFVLMHSGNVGLSQGLEVLLDVAERLRHLPDLVVAIVGDGAQKATLMASAEARQLNNVRFFPYQPKSGLLDSFATADVFMVSLKRGLSGFIVPSKLYGILAAGRPFVAAVERECEVAEIAATFECGLVVEPGDAGQMADAVEVLYADRARARQMAANARQAGLAFDRRRAVASYERVFLELAHGHVGRSVRPMPLAKRLLDVTLSGIGLLASAPLWAMLAAAIKLEDRGPVFYTQPRVGEGGRVFQVFKFRSMIPDAEARVGAVQATTGDPRVTRIGRIMRATAMDELPQLLNIFRGDMSFVGPRALRPGEIEVGASGQPVPMETIPGYAERHSVRPGLTGIAQIYAARDIPRRQKFRYDRLYLDRQSFWLDVRLIGLSFWISARGKWEAQPGTQR